jgi:ubiquinone biosynthesis monooxygenase Coq7
LPFVSAPVRDRLIAGFDRALRTFAAPPARTPRPSPAATIPEPALSPSDRIASGSLMRVNHTGEVCAQALYLGQSSTARSATRRRILREAAAEEFDHLDWCAARLAALDTHPSRLDPGWYLGAFAIGAACGLCGDRFNMGFLAETERQVVAHLDDHLRRLPAADLPSRAIVMQMKADEARHAATARRHGAVAMPPPIRWIMRVQAKIMTTVAAVL